MMKNIFVLIFFLFMCYENTFAQSCQEMMTEADKSANTRGGYLDALNKYNAVRRACPNLESTIEARIEAMFKKIDGLRQKAEKAEDIAEQAKKEAIKERDKSNLLYETAEEQRKKIETVLNKVFFFNDRFTIGSSLTASGPRYGILDKDRFFDEIDNTNYIYKSASLFEYPGYAKVQKDNYKYYLIDTIGNEYLLAANIDSLNSKTEALDLRGQNIEKFPEAIKDHRHLKVLLLDRNKISNIPDFIGGLDSLVTLSMGYNPFVSIPPEIGKIKNLKTLILTENKLKTLPKEIGQLKKLELLDIGGWHITTLPDEFWGLTTLKGLYMWGNPLSDGIPTAIGNLKGLQNLDLWHTSPQGLTSIPEEIGKLKNLVLN